MYLKLPLFLFISFVSLAKITEADFIDKILANEDYFAKDKIYLEIKKIELKASLEDYINWHKELIVEFENSYYNINKKTSSNSIYDKKRESNLQKIELNFEKNFLNNPSSLSIKLNKSFPSKNITRYKKGKFYNSYEVDVYDDKYTIYWQYPFLKRSNTKSRTYNNNILDLAKEQLRYISNKEDFLVDKLEDFLKLAALNEKHKILLNYLEFLQKINSNSTDDENRITKEINLANNDILSNSNKLEELKQKLTLSLNNKEINLDNIELDYNKNVNIINNYEEFIPLNNRELLIYDIDKKRKNNDIDYYQNESLAELNFSLEASKYYNTGNTLRSHYDNSKVIYSTRLSFIAPLGRDVNNHKNLAVAKLNLTKINLDYQAKFQAILSDVESLDLALRLNKKSINNYQKLINNMKNDLIKQYQNYNDNFIRLNELIVSLEQYSELSLDYIDLVLEYQINILDYNHILNNIIK